MVYLDDIVLHSKDAKTHLERLRLLLERLREANLRLKPSKCRLFQTVVSFLGYVVSADGISTEPSKVEAVQLWPQPQRVRDIRSFLGLCSYYRRFVPEFATIAEPLHELTHKGRAFVWTRDCQMAFDELKRRLTVKPNLVSTT